MPPSQLKQLKASLRDSGVIGPQQSKKQKRQNARTGVAAQNRNQRNEALQAIRDRFNPFEIKAPKNRSKFDATTRDGSSTTAGGSRPGVTKSLGEERRRATLLKEMNSRHKVGGILDRRFGENDPTMTLEERAAERYARESQKKLRKESMFNLEDDEDDDFHFTHMGQPLTLDGANVDDFDADGLDGQGSDDEGLRKRKRVVEDDGENEDFIDYEEEGEAQPEKKKSKAEVMKEVIAKSKFHKHERQKAKEDDDDLRDELDQELPDLFEALRGMKAPPKKEPAKQDLSGVNPERALLMQEPEKNTEREYDQRLKQLTFDKRSAPTDRTKTAEEKAEEEAERLKKMEENRLKRMRGEKVSDDEEEEEDDKDSFFAGDESEEEDDAVAFGLPTTYQPRADMGVEDEDDFVIDDDLVETRSNVSLSLDGSDMEEEELSDEDDEPDVPEQEDELINGMTLPTSTTSTAVGISESATGKLAFTYPCPSDHEGFLEIIKDVATEDVPTVVQRIRALHHPRIKPGNKDKLGKFSEILVEHVAYMADETEQPSFAVIENLLRHIHSLAKSHAIHVATAFRARFREISNDRPLSLLPGDLVILTGVSTVFPTSDHFHAVSTPAHLCIARYLGQCNVTSLSDLATGTFAASLLVQYQSVSERYMPEFINYVLNALCNLAPAEPAKEIGLFPSRKTEKSFRLASSKKITPRKLQFKDVISSPANPEAEEELKLSLVNTLVSLLGSSSDLWSEKSAFIEIFAPAREVLQHLRQSFKNKAFVAARDTVQSTLDKINTGLAQSHLSRRPLLLHNHRPLAIKSAIPKFEENFNPDKHYDPDRERAEVNRLKKEFKREKKGAMRELRKDASFIAREKLREKKELDAEYEKKYRKLIAEIQSEEGRAANDYEREKRARQGKR
ncbi:hypothetical protein N7532_011042 [Penicillium argentinense]|uniref:rRNA maturation protein n=1 Tax=Penicillium argentinense TaxID=1131581 RepID=A0A9W9EHR4_9EURO|nr:uncharacterized protein N7532_011042 [Penicillium argentinense]KAJ5081999.1 hypothetical protein N7532_011042 [Penicillium argentinense]